MAKLWFARNGAVKTRGGPVAELSVSECVEQLDLKQSHRMKLPEGETPKFGDPHAKSDWARDPKHVVIEIVEQDRAAAPDWQVGFYLLPMRPDEARAKLARAT